MTDAPNATQLLERWRSGDEAAATKLFELYSRKLTDVAERQMSAKLAQRVGPEDVVQSAFRTFFRRGSRGDFVIDNSTGLWKLLVKITLLKVYGQARRHSGPQRNLSAEVPMEVTDLDMALLSREPGPAEAAALVDLMHAATLDLPDTYGEILSLRLAGHSRAEIAAKVGVARQTVYRALRVMQQRCQSLADTQH